MRCPSCEPDYCACADFYAGRLAYWKGEMMADNTKIEWADATVNAINGCSLASPGCTNCYAMRLAGTRMKHHPSRAGLTQDSKAGPVWTGEVRLNEKALLEPLAWKRPRRIFWNAHGDTFHDAVPDKWIDRMFAVCALTPQHTHMILTKRSARMREFFRESTGWRARIAGLLNEMKPSPLWNGNVHQGWQNLHGRSDGLPNVWLGVSVEDQTRADKRIPDLLATPAAVRFISAEPLLGPVDLRDDWGTTVWMKEEGLPGIDWVIVGGESGPGARPMHPDWARSLRDQCADAGVAFHFKQWGDWAPGENCMLAVTRTETGATWWNNAWQFEEFTPRIAAELHTDDEPDLWKVGKRYTLRKLDGIEHNGVPQ